MPIYSFRNTETNEVKDLNIKFDSKEQYLKDNPQLEQIYTAMPATGDAIRMHLRGPDNGFKEVLSKINEKNYGSNLHENLSRN